MLHMKTTTTKAAKFLARNHALVEVGGRRGTVVGWCGDELLVDFGGTEDEWVPARDVKLV